MTFKPKSALLRAGLTGLLLSLGVLFCGPLVLLELNPARWPSYVALLLIYIVLVGLGLDYYRKHPRVRSRYTISEVGLGFHEFLGNSSASRTREWFAAHAEVVNVALTPQGSIVVHTDAGEVVVTTWPVADGVEFVKVARGYSRCA